MGETWSSTEEVSDAALPRKAPALMIGCFAAAGVGLLMLAGGVVFAWFAVAEELEGLSELEVVSRVQSGEELSAADEEALRASGKLAEGQIPLYFYAWSDEQGTLLTNEDVGTWIVEEDELSEWWSSLDRIETIELNVDPDWAEWQTVRITEHDESWIEFSLPLDDPSTEDFIAELERQARAQSDDFQGLRRDG